jgi:hypothetical protein
LKDSQTLLDKFEEEYSSLMNKYRSTWILSTGCAIGTWILAYSFRLKFTTFVLSTGFSFIASKYAINKLHTNIMKSNLNSFAIEVSNRYPEIKFSKVEYTNSSEVAPIKLI